MAAHTSQLDARFEDQNSIAINEERGASDIKKYIAIGCIIFDESSSEQRQRNGRSDADLRPLLHDLTRHGWIRTEVITTNSIGIIVTRVYALDRQYLDQTKVKLEGLLTLILRAINTDLDLWQGESTAAKQYFDLWALPVNHSLFYMFNSIASPAPSRTSLHPVKDKYSHEAMEDLLDDQFFTGLQSKLYPYQRRSAALMLQNEEVPRLLLDPRDERRVGPDGQVYFYNPRERTFTTSPTYYECCRGGILAETMGLGKTLITLALILATKNHPPKIPAVYDIRPARERVGSLKEMALTAIRRSSVPWQVELARMEYHGQFVSGLKEMLEAVPPSYEIPILPTRWNRNTIMPPPKRLITTATTVIVVPRNLCKQWHSEISKHVTEGALQVLVMEDLRKALPSADELRKYDIILFSRTRFELETRDGADETGRRAPPAHTPLVCRCPYIGSTRIRDCHCLKLEDVYDSPLKQLHFKRLVVDEGHSFSNTNSKAMSVADKLVIADHRWVISGTPAKDLLGVEMDLSARDDLANVNDLRAASLEQRRDFSSQDVHSGAVKSIGALANSFLQLRPWFAADGESALTWEDYIYRHEDSRRRTYTCFSDSLRRTLEALVVKTQPQDVEKDIVLPPLSHQEVYLEPSFYDKLTANLFTIVLTANAVTSERTDQDYLFHKNSQKPRQQLIANLRQSAFFWTGFSEDDVLATIKNGRGYLDKETAKCSLADRMLLEDTLKSAEIILHSDGWKVLSKTHELGVYVQDWPQESADHWSFSQDDHTMLTGVSQLLEAQKYVNERTADFDPGEGLAGLGIRSISAAVKGEDQSKQEKTVSAKSGIPSSSLDGEPSLRKKARKDDKSPMKDDDGSPVKGKRKRTSDVTNKPELPDHSPYRKACVVGSTSAKLSYLISQILRYYKDEKILVFYDGDNVAYYIAQMLELMHIKHEIYAKSLTASLKSEYVVRFDQEAQDRVLLMNVGQAAYGLNLTSASRIYFVNPVCRPNIEAQAIKRAHRIGQTRKVYVETLILRGTVEEKMHARAQRMTRSEHADARALDDDGGIRQIIQSAQLIPLNDKEAVAAGQMALFEDAQQIWGRDGWREAYAGAVDIPRKKKQRVESINEFVSPMKTKKPSIVLTLKVGKPEG